MQRDQRMSPGASSPKGGLELFAAAESVGAGEHGVAPKSVSYCEETVSTLRPRRRRAARTRRPFAVDIRLRKPCVRIRRRLWG